MRSLFELFVVAVLTYSSVIKLKDMTLFQAKLLKAVYFPADWIILTTWIIAIAEIGVILMLLFRKSRIFGLAGCYILFVLFTVHLLILHKISPAAPCSCGGIFELLSFNQHLVFNGFLIIISGGLFIQNHD